MKSLQFISISFFVAILIVPNAETFGQSNALKGKVALIQESTQKRISRGNSYRNRTKGEVLDHSEQSKENEYDQVIVSLKPLNFTPKLLPSKNANVYQKNKTFSPSLLPVTVGSTVHFINQDDFYHNVFSLTPKSRFNIGRRPAGSINGAAIKNLGVVKVFCDIHPQMKATILSLETPYFTNVSSSGTYQINELPNGKYLIEIYNSDHKINSEIIELKNGEILVRDLILDQNSTAYIENESYRLLAITTCCDPGIFCKKTAP